MNLSYVMTILAICTVFPFAQAEDFSSPGAPLLAKNEGERPDPPKGPSSYRFEEYDELIRNLNGRVDVVENQLAQYNASHQGNEEARKKDLQGVDQKFLAYEEALKKLEAQVLALSEELNKMKTAQATPAKGAPAKPKGTKANYDEGEALFNQKKWKDAILAYQKYRDANPKGKYYAPATYKMGVCFQELGMKSEAKVFFEEVISKFPSSKEAKKAGFRSKKLK